VEIATSVGFLAPSEMNSYGILQILDLWLLHLILVLQQRFQAISIHVPRPPRSTCGLYKQIHEMRAASKTEISNGLLEKGFGVAI
jgi:hypothetical protein